MNRAKRWVAFSLKRCFGDWSIEWVNAQVTDVQLHESLQPGGKTLAEIWSRLDAK